MGRARPRPIAVVRRHGAMLESARGPLPNLAEIVAGEPIRGSWWGHPASHAIFDAINQVADSGEVVRLRLVNGKVTLVHRRLWAPLVRLADGFRPEQLAAITEEHTSSGAHRKLETAFPGWVPAEVVVEAAGLTDDEALAALPPSLHPSPRDG
jgi:hypothetical protein